MGRAPCCDKANVKKGPWSPEEDSQLKDYITKHGTVGNWIALPQKAGLRRCGKSCRLRWLNYLRPNIKHGEFTDHEDKIICNLFATIGSRWSIIAAQLPGRTDNDIKNYWNTKLKKKLMRMAPSTTTTIPHQKRPNSLSSSIYLQNYYSSITSSTQILSSSPNVDNNNVCNYNNYSSSNNNSSFTSLLNSCVGVGPMQGDYNYYNNNNMIMFGRELASNCSSSDGSNNIYLSNEQNQKQQAVLFSSNNGSMSDNISSANVSTTTSCFSDHDQVLLPDYSIEEMKQFINTSNDHNNLNFFVDEIKTEEQLMFY